MASSIGHFHIQIHHRFTTDSRPTAQIHRVVQNLRTFPPFRELLQAKINPDRFKGISVEQDGGQLLLSVWEKAGEPIHILLDAANPDPIVQAAKYLCNPQAAPPQFSLPPPSSPKIKKAEQSRRPNPPAPSESDTESDKTLSESSISPSRLLSASPSPPPPPPLEEESERLRLLSEQIEALNQQVKEGKEALKEQAASFQTQRAGTQQTLEDQRETNRYLATECDLLKEQNEKQKTELNQLRKELEEKPVPRLSVHIAPSSPGLSDPSSPPPLEPAPDLPLASEPTDQLFQEEKPSPQLSVQTAPSSPGDASDNILSDSSSGLCLSDPSSPLPLELAPDLPLASEPTDQLLQARAEVQALQEEKAKLEAALEQLRKKQEEKPSPQLSVRTTPSDPDSDKVLSDSSARLCLSVSSSSPPPLEPAPDLPLASEPTDQLLKAQALQEEKAKLEAELEELRKKLKERSASELSVQIAPLDQRERIHSLEAEIARLKALLKMQQGSSSFFPQNLSRLIINPKLGTQNKPEKKPFHLNHFWSLWSTVLAYQAHRALAKKLKL